MFTDITKENTASIITVAISIFIWRCLIHVEAANTTVTGEHLFGRRQNKQIGKIILKYHIARVLVLTGIYIERYDCGMCGGKFVSNADIFT